MSEEPMNEEQKLVDLWRNQPLSESEIDMEMVIKAATTFQRKIRARNLLEYVASGAVVAWSGAFQLRSEVPLVVRVGVGLIGLGALVVATFLLLRRVPLWYLGPLVPGMVVILVGAWLAVPDQRLRVALTAALITAVFAGVAALNLRGARKLDQQITELGHGLDG
jgi:hypothetical protein